MTTSISTINGLGVKKMNDYFDEDGECNKEAIELLEKYRYKLFDDFKAKSWSDIKDKEDLA